MTSSRLLVDYTLIGTLVHLNGSRQREPAGGGTLQRRGSRRIQQSDDIVEPLEPVDPPGYLVGRTARVVGIVVAIDTEPGDDGGGAPLVVIAKRLPPDPLDADQDTGEGDGIGILLGLQLPVVLVYERQVRHALGDGGLDGVE